VRPSRGNSLENTGGALDRFHMDENDVEDEEVKSPIQPSDKALGKRRVVEEVDDGALRSHSIDDEIVVC